TETRERVAEPEQWDELGLPQRQPGHIGAVALDQTDAAVSSRFRVDRDARRGERLDVAVDRPDGDLEPLGQLARRRALAALKKHQDGEQTVRAHVEKSR